MNDYRLILEACVLVYTVFEKIMEEWDFFVFTYRTCINNWFSNVQALNAVFVGRHRL